MSNTSQEFCSQGSNEPCDWWTFMGQAAADSRVNHTTLVIVNGAAGGQDASDWDSPDEANYDRVRDTRLAVKGLTEQQVQIVWVKQADAHPTAHLPATNANAYGLESRLAAIARAVKVRYPNAGMIFYSSRIYAGYATGVSNLNPEPYAYEGGFSDRSPDHESFGQLHSGRHRRRRRCGSDRLWRFSAVPEWRGSTGEPGLCGFLSGT